MSIIIGISGISGAGTTTITKALGAELSSTCLFWDDFDDISESPNDFVEWFNTDGNYAAWKYPALEDVLSCLRQGFKHTHPVSGINLEPTEYVIVDVPLGRMHVATSRLVDIMIHLDTSMDVALARRLIRDRAHNPAQIFDELQWYLDTGRPLFDASKIKASAELICDGNLPVSDIVREIKKNMENPKLANYLSLCTEVYDLSKPVPPTDAYAFYRSYVEKAKGPILEPMCGTGRFLLPLLEEGFEVQGFDASKHMLEALHNKARVKNLKPNVWHGFIEDLAIPERFDLIFIPSGSFCLITAQATVRSALNTLYRHLADGGVLVFEAETFKSVPPVGVWRGDKWQRADGKMILLSSCASLEGNICSSLGKYDLVDSNKIIRTEVEELRVRLYEENELIKLLQEAGFSNVHAMKTFDKSAMPDEDAEAIVYECRRI